MEAASRVASAGKTVGGTSKAVGGASKADISDAAAATDKEKKLRNLKKVLLRVQSFPVSGPL